MTLATIRPDGYPQATTVNYVNDGLTLFFATDAASQKAGNIKRNNKVSIAIASETSNLYKLCGLSMSGTAERVCDTRRAQERALLMGRLFWLSCDLDIQRFGLPRVVLGNRAKALTSLRERRATDRRANEALIDGTQASDI